MRPPSSSLATAAPRRIFIVDDHAVVRLGVSQLINASPGLKVCGQAATVATALKAIVSLRPDLAIVDLSLGGESGLELIKLLKVKLPELPVLVLSMLDEAVYSQRAWEAGARGFVMKEAAAEELLDAIRRLLAGQPHVSGALGRTMLEQAVARPRNSRRRGLDRLTDRELEVLRLIGEGRTRAEIAGNFGLHVKTVATYRARLMKKLGLTNAKQVNEFAGDWVRQQR